jgi:hypothetical protein
MADNFWENLEISVWTLCQIVRTIIKFGPKNFVIEKQEKIFLKYMHVDKYLSL